jgi:DnaK suppressor protein
MATSGNGTREKKADKNTRSASQSGAGKSSAKKSAAKKSGSKKPADGGKAQSQKSNGEAAPEQLPVRAGEKPWTAGELDSVREVLAGEARRLRDEISMAESGIAEMLRDNSDASGEDQADTGSKTFEREHEISLAASHREILGQTERALTLIDEGTYGRCESCGNPIGKARLKAFPRATLCMSCKEREERR